MQRADFGKKLSELQRKYNLANFPDAVKKNIAVELQCLLQDYLWEGQGFKTFNRQKYRQLALAWHPDKLKDLRETSELSDEFQFLFWYTKRVSNENAPFQAINAVQGQYRPELRFRQQDATNTAERFYFFGSFSQFFPHTYNILWPFFYLLEALERNIDNYQNATAREWAKRIYAFLSLIPSGSLIILLAIVTTSGGIDLLLTLSDLLGSSWLSSMIYSALVTGITAMALYAVCTLYFIITSNREFDLTRNRNPTDNLLFELPLQALKEAYRNKNFTQFGLLSGVLITQVLVCAIGFSYAWPFLKMLCAFPLMGLILVNTPLLAKQCYENPRAALNIVKEYGFTIYNRYASLSKNLLMNLYHFVMSFLPQRQPAPAAHTPHESTQPEQAQQALPTPTHYWRQKFTKYLTKNVDALRQKRRRLKQQRNETLQHFRVNENHAFYERLEEQLNQKSILTDENGWAIDSDESHHENTTEALTTLNLKVQNLLLTQAQQKHIPFHQLENSYPNNLDYHTLKEKNNIEFSFPSLRPRVNRN